MTFQFSCSVVSDSATPWTAAHQASLSITISQSLQKLMSIESVMSSNYLILCCPLLLLPLIFPSIKVFSRDSVLCVRWSKYCSFSFSCSIRAAQWGQTKQNTWVSGEKKIYLQSTKENGWRRQWQPTPVFLPGESQGRGSLVGCRLWGCTESDTTEAT